MLRLARRKDRYRRSGHGGGASTYSKNNNLDNINLDNINNLNNQQPATSNLKQPTTSTTYNLNNLLQTNNFSIASNLCMVVLERTWPSHDIEDSISSAIRRTILEMQSMAGPDQVTDGMILSRD